MMLCLIYGQTILKALKGDYHKCGILLEIILP